ncbi:MAG: hypothetical protein KBT44_00085 [Bacteroidales bacterium]|nr:hypothetical protein [Candidatus Equibacterium intestinale]
MNKMRNVLNLAALITAVLVFCSCCKPKERELPPVNPADFDRYTKDMTFHSSILRETVCYSVLLPADYTQDTTKRYPVVYMLHGYGDNNNSWNGNYLHANDKIQSLESKGMGDMIYVFPRGFNSYYCNTYDGKYRYMDMFVEELVPYIDKSLRTIPDRNHRSITGYSMGGFGAMVLAEKHPEVFLCSAPLSMSFRTDKQYMSESMNGWNGQWGSIFGGIGEAGEGRLTPYYREHCPYYQFTPANAATLSQVKWYFTCGDDEEQLLIANDSLHVQLCQMDFAHEFRVADGAHTSTYWMEALNEVLPMFWYYMNGGNRWAGINMNVPSVPEVTFAEDGTLASEVFKNDGKGTAVYFVFDHADAEVVREAMALIYKKSSSFGYIYLPCDLSVRSFAEWREYWAGQYDCANFQAAAFGDAALDVWSHSTGIRKFYLVDPLLGEDIIADSEKQYIFVGSDEAEHCADMAALYRSCKANEAKYEYRVINATGNRHDDILRSIETIKQHFIY